MRVKCLPKGALLLGLLAALHYVAFAQSKLELAIAQAGIDAGFDPAPVEIPSVPKTARRPVTSMDLLMLRDIHGMQISPDGKYVAFVLGQAVYDSNSYRTGLFAVGTAKGSQLVRLGTAGPPRWDDENQWITEDPQWSPDSRYIYCVMKNANSWQVWRWDREGGPPVQVTRAEHNVQSFFLSSDGTKLLMMLETPSSVDRKKLAEQGILYDGSFEATAQPIIDRIAATPGGENEAWLQDLSINSLHKATEFELATFSLNSDSEHDPLGTILRKTFTQKEIDELHIGSFAISPDRKLVAYWRMVDNPSESEWVTYPLLVRPLSGGPPITLTNWSYYPGLFWWSPNSKEVYFTGEADADPNDHRKAKLMAVSAKGGKARLVSASPSFDRSYSVDRSGYLAAFVRESNATPSDVGFGDLSTGEIRTLVEVNPELQNLQIGPAQRIDVYDKHGERFWGHFVLPLGYEPGKRYPLVITTYADYDGFLCGGVGDEYPIHVLTANGFVVLNFNALSRMRSPKPGDFDSTLLLWQAPMEAMEAMVAKLSDMGIVDKSRVGITGLSYGAVLVNYGISHSHLFRAAIDSGGGSWDPILYYLADDAFRDSGIIRWQNLGLPEGDMLARYRKASVALNASSVHTPLLINASDAEYIRDMQRVSTLRTLKKPVEMFIYPDERHEKNQPKHRYSIYERNSDWFNFWLRDKEDPNPVKAEQYKRWRELRKLRDPL
jgi:dipeptidyl aminopeptidase/acylaminoacyl peptidase